MDPTQFAELLEMLNAIKWALWALLTVSFIKIRW